MGPNAVVLVDHGGEGVVVPDETAEPYVPGEELGHGNQPNPDGPLVARVKGCRVDAKVCLDGAAWVLEGLQHDELLRAKRFRLMRHGLEKLSAERELLILGLYEPHEVTVWVEQ